MTRKHFWTSTLVALLTLAATLGVISAKGKPPAPEPVPAGTIYFDDRSDNGYPYRDTLGMNADGSGLFQALPEFNEDDVRPAERSSLTYDTRPIWLVLVHEDVYYPGHNELYAVRRTADGSDLEWVQITEVNTDPNGSQPGIVVPYYTARWSNDGQDAFVSFVGYRYDWAAGTYDTRLFRLNVSGTEIALAFEFPEFWTPFGPDDVETVLIDDDLSSSGEHDWSPDGNKVAYQLTYTVDGLNREDICVWDGNTQSAVPLLTGHAWAPRWSPDGQRIACTARILDRNKSRHGVVTVNPDGTGLTMILESTSKASYSYPHWSPDGDYLALEVTEYVTRAGAPGGSLHHIGRIKADGSGLTIPARDISGRLLGWR